MSKPNMEMVAIMRDRSTKDSWIRLAREKLLIRIFDATLNKIMQSDHQKLFKNNCVHLHLLIENVFFLFLILKE